MSETADRIKNLFRNDKEESMVGEERDDENIDKQNTVGDRKRTHHRLGSADPGKGFVIGILEYVL